MSEFVVTFPTLGDLVDAWIEQHCRVANTFERGKPFVESDWQFWVTANHYRIRDGLDYEPGMLNQAFTYRRSQIVGPQKLGKGPWSASLTAAEACGPVLFGGYAGADDGYVCSENGCGCGWEFAYEPGEPMGIRQPSPLLQLTAISEDQVDNVWKPLTNMITLGPLSDLLFVRDSWIKIAGRNAGDPELDRIDKVTASANSRVGNPITFALQDESGLATDTNKMRKVYEAQRRNAAGIGGRTVETTNAWDRAENSVAQTTSESTATDVFRFHRLPPANLSYGNKRERRKIHEFVYFGSPWVNLDSIEGEAAELMEKDPAQAERFFGNRPNSGAGSWLSDKAFEIWKDKLVVRDRPKSEPICLGFDGSDTDDWTALRAETFTFHQFTPLDSLDRPTIWDPARFGGRIPRHDVLAAIRFVFAEYDVVRAYLDPPGWEAQVTDLQGEFGEQRVVEWYTNRPKPMHDELERFRNDVVDANGTLTHDADKNADTHLRNAVMRARPNRTYILGKPTQHQKIDVVMASVLAHAAVSDAVAAGDLGKRGTNTSTTYYAFS